MQLAIDNKWNTANYGRSQNQNLLSWHTANLPDPAWCRRAANDVPSRRYFFCQFHKRVDWMLFSI